MVDDLRAMSLTDADVPRISAAFQAIALNKGRWPNSHMVKENLPPRLAPKSLPAPKNKPSADVLSLLREALERSSAKRSVLQKNESVADYLVAMGESGKSKDEFDRERLTENGWTDGKERAYAECMRNCRFRCSQPKARTVASHQPVRPTFSELSEPPEREWDAGQ